MMIPSRPEMPESVVKSRTAVRSSRRGNRARMARSCSASAPASLSTDSILPSPPSSVASAIVKAPVPDPRSAQKPPLAFTPSLSSPM